MEIHFEELVVFFGRQQSKTKTENRNDTRTTALDTEDGLQTNHTIQYIYQCLNCTRCSLKSTTFTKSVTQHSAPINPLLITVPFHSYQPIFPLSPSPLLKTFHTINPPPLPLLYTFISHMQ